MDHRMRQDEAVDGLAAQTFAPLEQIVTITPTEVRVSDDGFVQVGDDPFPVNEKRLTGKERALLLAVMRRKGVCTKDFLLQELYAGMDEPLLKIIDVFACKVRKKLGNHAGMMDTVWGRGYACSAEYRLAEPSAYLRIEPDLRKRIDDLAMAQGCLADEMASALLLRAVVAKEKETWA